MTENNNFIILQLPEVAFSIATLQEHYFKNVQKDDYANAKNYIQQYYFETACGMYYFYDAFKQSFECREKKDFTSEVLKKVENNKSIVKYFDMNAKIYRVSSRIDRPSHYVENGNYFINECRGLKHKTYKHYDEYDQKIKKNVEKMLSFMLEITCAEDKTMFDSLIKYYSQICKGIKTEVILYKKSIEGVGKSTESDFMMDYVLGRDVAVIGNTDPLLSSFNKCLMGKLLIVFEELPTFSEAQWRGVSSKLKTLTTEKHTYYQDKYEKQIYAENLNNFIINTNVESIKNSDGRRIAILEISHKRFRDHTYFDDLRLSCFNDIVGEAFFSYLMTKIDVSNFYGQRDFPETDKKKTAIANFLPLVHKFLKFDLLLKNEPQIKIVTSVFYTQFSLYCVENNMKPIGRNDFYDKLNEIGINRGTKTNGNYHFTITMEKLRDLSKKYKWICKYDEEDMCETYEGETESVVDDFDYKTAYFELLAKQENRVQITPEKFDDVSIITETKQEETHDNGEIIIIDDVSVLTEISDSVSSDDNNIEIYRETYPEQFEKLEKFTKNISSLNKKLNKICDSTEFSDLEEQSRLIGRIEINKDKIESVYNSLSKPVAKVIKDHFN